MNSQKRRWVPDEDEIMVAKYATTSTVVLSEELNRTPNAVVLRAKHLKLSKSNAIYTTTTCDALLNNSLESYYWIGFILADGHITPKYRLKITLASIDSDHLERLALLLNCPTHFAKYNTNNFNVIGNSISIAVQDSISIKELAERYDIAHNKTIIPPTFQSYRLTDDQWLALIIGFLDGDASITKLNRTSSPYNIIFKNHAAWLPNLNYIKIKLTQIFDIDSTMQAKLNTSGYAKLAISDMRIIVGLKKFIVEHGIPALERKWCEVPSTLPLTHRHKLFKREQLAINILLKNSTYNKSAIAREFNVSISAITTLERKSKNRS